MHLKEGYKQITLTQIRQLESRAVRGEKKKFWVCLFSS